jgi:lipopolysaccharide transport system permease protein
MQGIARSLFDYRYFIFNSIRNDFYARFVRSKLGGVWLILHPLSQVLIYAFILSNLLSSRLPGVAGTYAYAVYLMAGLLAWNLFTEIIDRCVKIFIVNGNTIKKVSFPRIALPIIAIGSALVNNLVLFVVMNVIFLVLGHPITPVIALYFVLTPLVAALAAGVGLILGVLNVFIRDIEQVVPILLQVLFWFTPIVYPVSIIPEQYIPLLQLSPIFTFVEAYHQMIVYHQVPQLGGMVFIGVLAALLCLFAFTLFRRASADMVDAL